MDRRDKVNEKTRNAEAPTVKVAVDLSSVATGRPPRLSSLVNREVLHTAQRLVE